MDWSGWPFILREWTADWGQCHQRSEEDSAAAVMPLLGRSAGLVVCTHIQDYSICTFSPNEVVLTNVARCSVDQKVIMCR